nr:class I SAM-dependent methyltransferase [Microbulbifer sediminum]
MAVIAAAPEWLPAARELSVQLGLDLLENSDPRQISDPAYVLRCGEMLELCATGRKAPGPVVVDFVGGAAAHRRKYGGGKGQQIAKAVGVRAGFKPRVVDATGGLGRDAFVLASVGCEVLLLERNPVVRALLADGLSRLRAAATMDPELAAVAGRLQLSDATEDSASWLAAQPAESIPVVYLDPMFPARGKSAKVKKEMAVFHLLVGEDPDADALLEPALGACYYRTVVKRPRLAPHLAGRKPDLSLEGKSGRFDIYTRHGVPG